MDGQAQDGIGSGFQQAVTLFGHDTVETALRAMEEFGVHSLSVVDDEHGEFLGEVTEERLLSLFEVAPQTRMAELLTDPQDNTLENSQPEVLELAPLVDFFGRHRREDLN